MKISFYYYIGSVLFHSEYTIVTSGHVCSKQRAETYTTNYDRSFICPERYTTACGQLDWRRCTKYRVSTCYTPSQKYAVRYVTVEVCCPGWRGDTCNEPICPGSCQNGGVCADLGDHPGCRCLDGYYGEMCEHERNHVDTLEVILVCCVCVVTLVIIVIGIIVYKRRGSSRRTQVVPYIIPTVDGNMPGIQSNQVAESRPVPSAPHFRS